MASTVYAMGDGGCPIRVTNCSIVELVPLLLDRVEELLKCNVVLLHMCEQLCRPLQSLSGVILRILQILLGIIVLVGGCGSRSGGGQLFGQPLDFLCQTKPSCPPHALYWQWSSGNHDHRVDLVATCISTIVRVVLVQPNLLAHKVLIGCGKGPLAHVVVETGGALHIVFFPFLGSNRQAQHGGVKVDNECELGWFHGW
jgi:hypothetical protein